MHGNCGRQDFGDDQDFSAVEKWRVAAELNKGRVNYNIASGKKEIAMRAVLCKEWGGPEKL